MKNIPWFSLAFILLSVLPSAGLLITGPGPIKLLPANLTLSPTEFYINSVSDGREDRSLVAMLLFAGDGNKPVLHAVDLEGGGSKALRSFLQYGLKGNISERPLHVRIKECKIMETQAGVNRVSGLISIMFELELEKEWGNIPLTSYRSEAKYTRSINNLSVVEPALRQILSKSLSFINSWMSREAGHNIHLAKEVRISFTDYLDQDADTIYYQPTRPLTWNDFQDKPRDNRYSAAVFSSFGYEQASELKNGIIHVNLAMKVYTVKSASWVAPGMQNPYSLNHEQRHFDLVKLIAGRFKGKLTSEKLTPDNYQGIINYEYLEFYRQMNQLQKKYDSETGHGTNQGMQKLWNRNIDTDLADISMSPSASNSLKEIDHR